MPSDNLCFVGMSGEEALLRRPVFIGPEGPLDWGTSGVSSNPLSRGVNVPIPSKVSCSKKKQSELTHTLALLPISVTQNPKLRSFQNRSD